MAERNRFSDALQRLKDRLKNPDNTPETITQIQAAILQTGLLWQREEPWWEASRMRREIINQGYGTHRSYFLEFAKLKAKGLLEERPDEFVPIYLRVTDLGGDERAKVLIRPQETQQPFKGLPQTT